MKQGMKEGNKGREECHKTKTIWKDERIKEWKQEANKWEETNNRNKKEIRRKETKRRKKERDKKKRQTSCQLFYEVLLLEFENKLLISNNSVLFPDLA
jgi:hypothetical protein